MSATSSPSGDEPGGDPRELYEHAPCGHLLTGPDGTITRVNQTFLSLTGHRAGDLVGRRTFASLLTAGGRIYHETHYAPLLSLKGTVREVALDLVRADGERVSVLVNAEQDVVDGRPGAVRIAAFPASHRREYERELLRAKQRAEQSELRVRALARTLQSTLIPPSPPQLPGLELSAAYRPAGDGEEVGGDFYDVFQLDADDWVVALGDVVGKGVGAAVVTALVRHTIRAHSVRMDRPSEVLHALNRTLIARDDDQFCTVVLLRLRRVGDGWTASVTCGGHPLPLHLDSGGSLREVGHPGSVVGLLEDVEFVDDEVPLARGDLLVVYTDGVTEGRRGREFFDEERLHRSLTEHRTAEHPAERVLGEVVAFQGGRPRDDIALVSVRVPPAVDPTAGEHLASTGTGGETP